MRQCIDCGHRVKRFRSFDLCGISANRCIDVVTCDEFTPRPPNRHDWKREPERLQRVYSNPGRRRLVRQERPGRNDPCPCGSGKKFKRCCL